MLNPRAIHNDAHRVSTLQQFLENLRFKEDVAVQDQNASFQKRLGSEQGNGFTRVAIVIVVEVTDAQQVDSLFVIPTYDRDVGDAVGIQLLDLTFEDGLAFDVKHALGLVGGQWKQLIVRACRQDHGTNVATADVTALRQFEVGAANQRRKLEADVNKKDGAIDGLLEFAGVTKDEASEFLSKNGEV